MKDMFYYSGMVNNYDGRCDDCPYRVDTVTDGWYCNKSVCMDVNPYVHTGRINYNCPLRTKDEES